MMSKEAYYFSHDANARHDPKILAMRSEYGIQGYGIYWVIVEMLREAEDFKLPLKKYMWDAIAMQVQCKEFAKDDAKSFVENCINEYELFETDEEYFWSKSLLKRMDKKNDVSEKRRAAAKKRWDKSNPEGSDANAMQKDANAMQTDAIKGKEIKRKEIKTTTTTKGQDAPNPFGFYQQNFGVLSPFMADDIGQWMDELNDELVIESMKIALKAGKKWNYAAAILKEWHRNNVKTVDEAKAMQPGKNKKGVDWEGLA